MPDRIFELVEKKRQAEEVLRAKQAEDNRLVRERAEREKKLKSFRPGSLEQVAYMITSYEGESSHLSPQQAANLEKIRDIIANFEAWIHYYHIAPEHATSNGTSHPAGWVIGQRTYERGEGYQFSYINYALHISPSGRLNELCVKGGRRKRYAITSSLELEQYKASSLEEAIAGIVLRSGAPWPVPA